MFKTWRTTYFSFDGRLGRFAFFRSHVYLSICILILVISSIPLFSSGSDDLWWVALILLIFTGVLWAGAELSLIVRRLHEIGLPGYHSVWIFISIVVAQILSAGISNEHPFVQLFWLLPFGIFLWLLLWPGKVESLHELKHTGLSMQDAWYYADRNGRQGPHTLNEVRETLKTLSPEQVSGVLVWREGFPNWKPATDVAELGIQSSEGPPPLPEEVRSVLGTSGSETPVLGFIAIGLGVASLIVPYFAAVFFVPAGLICAVIAYKKQQTRPAVAGLILGLLGLVGVIYTSQQITSALSGKPTSLLQSPFSAPAVVTLAKYKKIHQGMTYEDVRSIIGDNGSELSRSDISGMTTVMYSWTNSDGSSMNAMFQNDKLITKSQFELR